MVCRPQENLGSCYRELELETPTNHELSTQLLSLPSILAQGLLRSSISKDL